MILKGKRVTLRSLTEKDAKRLVELMHDKTIHNYMHVPYPYTPTHARKFIRDTKKNMAEKLEYRFAIVLNKTDELIGTCGANVKMKDKKGSMGYWIGKEYRGNEYALEASKLLINCMFSKMKINKICIRVAKGNEPSKRIAEKLGAKLEGVLRKDAYTGGKFRDCYSYGILKEEWKNG